MKKSNSCIVPVALASIFCVLFAVTSQAAERFDACNGEGQQSSIGYRNSQLFRPGHPRYDMDQETMVHRYGDAIDNVSLRAVARFLSRPENTGMIGRQIYIWRECGAFRFNARRFPDATPVCHCRPLQARSEPDSRPRDSGALGGGARSGRSGGGFTRFLKTNKDPKYSCRIGGGKWVNGRCKFN